jgi:Flp pilus assembly pilin Flp
MTPFAFAKRSLARDASGAAAVEFAMIAPALFTCIVGTLMLGMAYYEGATIQWTLERQMRTAMINPDATGADIEAAIAADLEQIGSPDIEFTYVLDASGSVPITVMTADYEVPLRVPFLPDLALHFSAETVAPSP